MNSRVRKILSIYVIFIIVALFWMVLEQMILGETRPDSVDSIIAIILSVSLYFNFKNSKKFKQWVKDNF